MLSTEPSEIYYLLALLLLLLLLLSSSSSSLEVCTEFWWGTLRERDHLEDPGLDGIIILRWIFRKWVGGGWTGLIWLGIGTGGGTCKCGNKPSDSIKFGEFLD